MGISFQVLCSCIACYVCLNIGLIFAWPSCTIKIFESTNTTLNRPMGESELALFGSLSSMGAMVSTPLAGFSLDRLGRKYSTILFALAHVIAWSLIAVCNQVEIILFAIFLSGFGGSLFLIVTIYVGEMCQESIRGCLTSGPMIFYGVGLLMSYILGGFLSYKMIIYVCLSSSVLAVMMLMFLKESPTLLMKRGLEDEAASSIAFYRRVKQNSKEVLHEMLVLRRAFNPFSEETRGMYVEINIIVIDLSPEEEKLKPLETVTEDLSFFEFIKKSQSTRRAITATIVIVTLSLFQGLVVIQVYAEPLFADAIPDGSMSPTLCSVVLAIVTVITMCIAAYLTDVAGRRPLMIYSSIAGGLCCVALGTQLQFHWAPHWVTALIIYIFSACYSFGPGTVPYILGAEVFLPAVKSIMSMLAVEWAWLCNFVILFIFNPLASAIGLATVFYIFGAIGFVTSVFCALYQPETKGMTVDAIQLQFSKRG